VHYADKKHAVQDILALLLPAPATPQDPTPVPKQAEQPKQAAAPAPKQSATKRAEAPPPPKKKEPPQNDPAPTKCIPIDYVVEDIRDRDGEAAEWHFDRMYTRHYVCLSLPLTSLSDPRDVRG